MNRNNWKGSGGAMLALALFFSVNAFAQIPQAVVHSSAPGAYDAARETVLQGKVISYSATSKSGPLGARIALQTSSGTVDVHAGNAKLIEASHLALQAGDEVSITGEKIPFGNSTVFVARLIQKGMQSIAVRSKNGSPLMPTARSADGRIVAPAGAR